MKLIFALILMIPIVANAMHCHSEAIEVYSPDHRRVLFVKEFANKHGIKQYQQFKSWEQFQKILEQNEQFHKNQ